MHPATALPRARTFLTLLIALLLVPLMTLGAASSAHGAVPTLTGSVSDGLGDPLAGVQIDAVDAGAPSSAVAFTISDAEGAYALDLPQGSYRLRLTKAGYQTAWYGDGVDVTVDADGTPSVDGEPLEDGLLDDVTLTSVASYEAHGTVRATNGPFLAGITVSLYADLEDESPVSATATNANGQFTLEAPGGYYYVRFADPSLTHVDRWYGDGEPESVRLDADLDLGAITLAISSANTEHTITGSASDALGVGIDGLTVTVNGLGATTGTTTATTAELNEEAGRYTVALRPGTYQATFSGTGYVSTLSDAVFTVAANGTLSVNGVPQVTKVLPDVIVASTPFTVNGQVVADATSNGLGGITVRADGDEPITATTQASGSYALPLPIGSYSVQASDLDGVAPHYISAWLGGAADVTLIVAQQGVLTIDDGAPIQTLPTIRLQQAAADSTYPASGWVLDANGDGVTGVSVSAVPVSGSTPLGEAVTVTTAAGDDAGRFDLALKAGTYELRTTGTSHFGSGVLAGDEESPARVRVSASGVTVDGETADAGDVGSITVSGLVDYPLSGTATDGTDGLPGITVEAHSVDTDAVAATTATDSDGLFTFAGAGSSASTGHGLRIGTYKLRFTDRTSNATRYRDAWFGGEVPAEVQVGQGGTITVDGVTANIVTVLTAVSSDATFDLLGTVYDPEFEPLDGVTVTATPLSGTPAANAASGVTGPDPTFGEAGVYRLPVRPGRYRMQFAKDGYQPQTLADYDTGAPITVTVSATGTVTAPGLELTDGVIDDVQLYLTAAEFATLPTLTGKVAVGSTVVTTAGLLRGASIDQDSVYVEWFLDGKPADDYSAGAWGQKFKVTTAAAGRKLSYRVTIDDPDGLRASSVFTSKAVTVPKAPATVKASVKKAKLTITVAVPTWSKPTGTLVVKAGKKVIATIKLTAKAKGKATISLAKLKRGKHTLKITYTGPASIKPATTKVKYKK